MATDLRKFLAFGTGVGVQIDGAELHVTIVRVRPRGIAVLGSATVTDFINRPAVEWGSELLAFLRKLGCGYIAATVLLPRRDVIVRQIQLPGVTDNDLKSAVQLQVDSLHPFAEEDATYTFARLLNSSTVVVGITRHEVIEHYSNVFAEAGIKVASFTFSAAALYSALRILHKPPSGGFLALHPETEEVEVYGESESRPMYSATLPSASQAGIDRAAAELRLPPGTEPVEIENLLPRPSVFPPNHDPAGAGFRKHALPYATAVAAACPLLSIQANLLPQERRQSSSRLRLAPTIALAVMLLVAAGVLLGYTNYENGKYLERLNAEIKQVEPQARKVEQLDKAIAATRARTQLLDDFKRRSKADLDALGELTKLVPPPGWVSNLEIRRTGIVITGEVDQAANLLKTLDDSPLFERSEFTMSPARVANGEVFALKAAREGNQGLKEGQVK
jgi:Tfp pilus assembly protein PilN